LINGDFYMKNNPFNLTFGKEPTQMISRINQTAEIMDNFTSDVPGQQIYMITGVRGSGKTVFMTSIQKRLQKDPSWIVTEINSSGDILKEFVTRLYNIKGMPKKFAADGINLSFWGLGVNIRKEEPITDPVTAIERMLDRIVKDKKKILITIDEVYNSPEMKYFAGTLQMLIRHDAFCSVHRTLMRFRADILRSKTDALKRSVISYFITTA